MLRTRRMSGDSRRYPPSERSFHRARLCAICSAFSRRIVLRCTKGVAGDDACTANGSRPGGRSRFFPQVGSHAGIQAGPQRLDDSSSPGNRLAARPAAVRRGAVAAPVPDLRPSWCDDRRRPPAALGCALRQVSVTAIPGAVTCVLGRNGVGKTSLLRAITGAHPVSAGSIRWEGADITRLPMADGSYDVVIANHVLEHIDDDRQAIRELFRVLRPNGTALLTVPLNPTRAATYEDPRITDPVQRMAHFNAPDHRRYYGLDFADRLQDAGFQVETFRMTQPDEVRFSLLPMEWLYIATRPG
ncbi:MAG: hypothetical protein B7Z80_22805 [Rhodospirillales bacterium 20-64-7]|nr:MAG: hypothetical protein B7Z80_22805 [Rhodospirillales bacterium 20-64-7]